MNTIIRKLLLVFAIAVATVSPAWPQTTDNQTTKSPLDGAWELVSGQPLPKGTQDIKIISGGHFIFAAYGTVTGKPRYTGGGTFTLNGTSYIEHVDFMSEEISAGMIGKDQSFTVKIEGDTFSQIGVLSSGKNLSEVWKRMK